MTYLQFHLVFIVPVLLALAGAVVRTRALPDARARWCLPLLAGLALAWTTPWDNYLVARGIWGYGSDRVLGTLGWVPYEEYAFFLLQPFLTGLWFYLVLARAPGASTDARRAGITPIVFWLVLAVAGIAMLARPRTTYLGLILVWACPVLAGQWWLGGRAIRGLAVPVIVGCAVPTLYLWIADRVAIGLGIWQISDTFTIGLRPFGLPVEEAVFFLLTNVLIVQGLVLFLDPRHPSTADPPA